MPSLFINTSSSTETVAVLRGQRVLSAKSWRGKFDESKKLLPNIMKTLKSARVPLNKIKRIIIAAGPGQFSALRIGATVANVMSRALNAALFSIDTVSLWKLRLTDSLRKKNPVLLLHAGGMFTYREGGGFKNGLFEISNALKLPKNKSMAFFGDITENEAKHFRKAKTRLWRFISEEKLLGAASAIAGAKSTKSKLKKVRFATPRYFIPPKITIPKIPYKT